MTMNCKNTKVSDCIAQCACARSLALSCALLQREAKDKARIRELNARIRALEEDRMWFDKEVCVRERERVCVCV